MGEGVTRVVATDTRVQTLSQEIARMRIRLTAVLTELDRRRHNATEVKHLARAHAGAVAAGALMLAAIVATPMLKVWRRRGWAHQGVTLTDRARRLGRALGRVAHDPDRLTAQPPPRMLGMPPKTLATLVLTTAQILAETMHERRRRRERRRRNEAAPRRDGMHQGRATGVASGPAPDGSGLPSCLHRSQQGSAY